MHKYIIHSYLNKSPPATGRRRFIKLLDYFFFGAGSSALALALPASASASSRARDMVPRFCFTDIPCFLVPSKVYAPMDAVDELYARPFSRPIPPEDAWDGIVIANAWRATSVAPAVNATNAARRSTFSALATTRARRSCLGATCSPRRSFSLVSLVSHPSFRALARINRKSDSIASPFDCAVSRSISFIIRAVRAGRVDSAYRGGAQCGVLGGRSEHLGGLLNIYVYVRRVCVCVHDCRVSACRDRAPMPMPMMTTNPCHGWADGARTPIDRHRHRSIDRLPDADRRVARSYRYNKTYEYYMPIHRGGWMVHGCAWTWTWTWPWVCVPVHVPPPYYMGHISMH